MDFKIHFILIHVGHGTFSSQWTTHFNSQILHNLDFQDFDSNWPQLDAIPIALILTSNMYHLPMAGGVDEITDSNFGGLWNHPHDNELRNLLEGFFTIPDMMQNSNRGVQSAISGLKKSMYDLTCEESDIKEQLQLLESWGKKHHRHVDYWLEEVEELKEEAGGVVELTGVTRISGLEIQHLTKQVQRCKEEKPLVLCNELIGKRFEKNIKKVRKLLEDDNIFKIGIHGMGGVGKTCLVNHIKDEITRKCTFGFKHVFWVTASQDVHVFYLQNVIAKRIGVKLDEDDERIRAEILLSELMKKEKSLFILDNVWNYIDLQKVGIPLKVKGNKLILTSRLKHVCRQMDCHIIRMKLLQYFRDDRFFYEKGDEDQVLFLLKLGFHETPSTFSQNVLEIASSVADSCQGLPLGISVMARTMKGLSEIHSWRHKLSELQNSKMGEEMEEEVFKILKVSYDNLADTSIQRCFLHCALFSKVIERKDLIMNLVDEGEINGMRSLEETLDEGRGKLDKLVDHSLLLEKLCVLWMHGLMREMVCHYILKDRSMYMVKCNKRLRKIPDMQEWTANLEKVSLMDNNITEIPAGTSPYCPKLSTLIFGYNSFNSIPDCFFSHMNALTLLDLSSDLKLECLPNSVANLRSLISLLLINCVSLKYVPPLGQLQKLSRLIITNTEIEEVPQGCETLFNLKWLDLSENEYLTLVPGFVLPSLTKMQYLDLCSKNVKVKVEDIQGMNMLEYFGGCFHDCNNYNDFIKNVVDKDFGPKTYHILSGVLDVDFIGFPYEVDIEEQTKIINFGDCEELPHLLPTNLTSLRIQNNKQWRCLCRALSFKLNGPSLHHIEIKDCPELESLFCLSGSCSLCTPLRFPQGFMFYHLKNLDIYCCQKMEKLMAPGLLKQLQNLVSLSVWNCHSMKEIFPVGSYEEEEEDDNYSTITLSKLTNLSLRYLPKLKTVCKGIMVCGSSEVLRIEGCPSLERHPTIQVFSDYVS